MDFFPNKNKTLKHAHYTLHTLLVSKVIKYTTQRGMLGKTVNF